MKVIIKVGIANESKKALLVSFWTSGNYKGFKNGEKFHTETVWIPKSQVKILEEKEEKTSYTFYSNIKAVNGYIVDGKAHKVVLNRTLKIELPKWLYKDKMCYGFDII